MAKPPTSALALATGDRVKYGLLEVDVLCVLADDQVLIMCGDQTVAVDTNALVRVPTSIFTAGDRVIYKNNHGIFVKNIDNRSAVMHGANGACAVFLRNLQPFACPFVPGDKLRCLVDVESSRCGDECTLFFVGAAKLHVKRAKCNDISAHWTYNLSDYAKFQKIDEFTTTTTTDERHDGTTAAKSCKCSGTGTCTYETDRM